MPQPKEIDLSKLSSIDWCSLTDPPCPHKVYEVCGISEILKGFYTIKEKRRMAKIYLDLAERDPKGFQNACLNALLS